MAEGGCLENSCSGDGTGGSNPPLSASFVIGFYFYIIFFWRGVRVAEGARLESVCAFACTEGSNPSLSAIFFFCVLG